MATVDFSPRDIRSIRETLGLTQEQFAERCGVQHTTVSHWENGLRNPSGAASMLLDNLRKNAEKRRAS